MTEMSRRLIFVGAGVAGAALMMFASGSAYTADAPEWTVDPAKSSIAFTARQMGVPSTGTFKTFKATVKFDPDALDASVVEVIVDAVSADTGNPDIDKELKQEKWFDVTRFPTVRFATTAFRTKTKDATGKGVYEAVAKLTIRDVTEEVVLPFQLDIGPDPADAAKLVARVKGDLTLSRTRFGVGQGEWRDTKIVGDEVGLQIDVLARRTK
jgi:polyisoprenoid-binding protein YceI